MLKTIASLTASGLAIAAALLASPAMATTATTADFGTMADGTVIKAVTLKNSHGVSARLISYGATLQSLWTPDRAGKSADIVIGFDTLDGYVNTPGYTNVTVGRYANRIANATFSLDGQTYHVTANEAPNMLHGGAKGFDKHAWTVAHVDAGGAGKPASVTFAYTSADGEEGFPGTVKVEVTYALNENNDLTISYKATTDKPTVINLTNHGLFNLGGIPATRPATEALLKLEADSYMPTDAAAIPTGEIKPVKGTVFDFTKPAVISSRVRDTTDAQIAIGHGFDHNVLIRGGLTKTPKLAVTLSDAITGRGMQILTTEPGIQFYSGNFLDGKTVTKGGHVLLRGDAVAFEAQHYPDSPNHPDFPTTRLDPGQTYTQVTVHHFYTVK